MDGIQLDVQGSNYMQHQNSGGQTEVSDTGSALREKLLNLRLEAIRKGKKQNQAISPRVRDNTPVPLSFAQERLWFLDQLGLAGIAYNMPFALRLTGQLNEDVLERSFIELVRRHEILRTRIVVGDGVPYQVVDTPGNFEILRGDLSDLTERDERERCLAEWTQREVAHRFDLAQELPFRVVLILLDSGDYSLLVTIHHIASDGWSFGVLIREINTLYAAYSEGRSSPLPELQVQYADYAIWQRHRMQGEILEKQLAYWKQHLAGAPPHLQLPTDRPRPAIESSKGAVLEFALPAKLMASLEELGRSVGATLFMTVLAAYQILLSRYSGQEDIVVGSPIAGRTRQEVEGLIGLFVNTVALRASVSGELSFREFLSTVRDATFGAYEYQELPFEALVKELRPERNLTRQPIFQVALSLQNYPEARLELQGLSWTWANGDWVSAHFDLGLYFEKTIGGLSGSFEYATDLFDRETIERMTKHLQYLLENAVACPDCQVKDLKMMSAGERQQVLDTWSAGKTPHQQVAMLHELFEEQVARAADAIAVTSGQGSLSYGELNRRANLVGWHLRLIGVGAEKPVCVCFPPGLDGVIALLGVLKAGGTYIPLDVDEPVARLQYLLKRSMPVALLTHERYKAMFPQAAARLVALDADWSEIARHKDFNLDARSLGLSCNILAYVVYSSGSTGRPIGAMNEHRAVVNALQSMRDTCQLGAVDRVLQANPASVDASILEQFVALISGACLVIGQSDENYGRASLRTVVQTAGVTALYLFPAALRRFLEDIRSRDCPTLRRVICSGVELSRDLQKRFFQQLPTVRLMSFYGPSEAAGLAAAWECDASDPLAFVAIGRPVSNARIYVLDRHRQPAPVGVMGQIYVGGVAVGRGYLGQPELTEAQFFPDPFGDGSRGRIYATGDLGRWRADGVLEYLGRNDDRINIHGRRVEPAEIEQSLSRHPWVKQAAIACREDALTQKHLVCYVVGDRTTMFKGGSGGVSAALRAELVNKCEKIYEEANPTENQVERQSFGGWLSSYDGQAIPEAQMREWLMDAVGRVLALNPNEALEIGCGVGVMLQHIAPHCAKYVATDISAQAIARLRRWTALQERLRHVELLNKSAIELQELTTGTFDTVVLNSVVQYFPCVEYLLEVIQEAIRLLRPGGNLFIGDVRHLETLATFHTGMQLNKASAGSDVGQLRCRISRSISQERELVVSPQFFRALLGRMPGVSAVKIQTKRGRSENELTRYRYDVVIRTGSEPASEEVYQSLKWGTNVSSISELEAGMRERRLGAAVRLQGVPNQRTAREFAAMSVIESAAEDLEISGLRSQLEGLQIENVEPEQVWRLAEVYGYDANLAPGDDGTLEVKLLMQADPKAVLREVPSQPAVKPWSAYANDPLGEELRDKLVQELQEYLGTEVPDYMRPSAWVVLRQLPTTTEGGLDRRALPSPELETHPGGGEEALQGQIESLLAKIWRELLQIDQVDRHDSFFEIGGHSLLGIKALFQVNQAFGSNLRVLDLYRSPTIKELAERIRGETFESRLVNLSKEAILDLEIRPQSALTGTTDDAVFLTGASGFVGRFLLSQLLHDTNGTVYCLVRAASPQEGMSRLRNTLMKWDLWRDEFERRIVAIPGDMSQRRLGMDEASYVRVCNEASSIYDCATSMNHLETYAMARRANVEGVKELLRVAVSGRGKAVNYISTVGVFNEPAANTTRVVDETTPIDEEKHSAQDGYIASKWVGEKILLLAAERGIPCNIFRLGFIWGDASRGRYDELQRDYRIFKSCVLSGCGIRNYRYASAPIPVDYTARAVVFLGTRHLDGGQVFHLSSPEEMTEGVFEQYNRIATVKLDLMSYYEWICEIRQLHQRGRTLPAVPLVEYAFSMDERAFQEYEQAQLAGRLIYDMPRTRRELESAGIVLPALDNDLFRVYVAGMLRTDADLQKLNQPIR